MYNFKDLIVYIELYIGDESETFCKGLVKERKDIEKYPLISIIIKHPNNEASDRTGIKDAFFIKENIISMTKRAINQSMVISLPYIKLTGIVWDIGCNESLYEIIEDVMRKNPRYLLSCGGRNE